jgi:hypothetical protein
MKRNNMSLEGSEWYIFAGCTLLGLGIGMAVGSAGAGLVIGAGVGFLAMVFSQYLNR